jgi:hypothetical protein
MKFANNHEYRFENNRIAWLAGCMQMFMIITVEMVNFLSILTSTAILDVVMNFMALAIIADFDDCFYSALGNDPNKLVLSDPAYDDMFIIRRTTSRNCSNKIDPHLLDDDTYEMSLVSELE